jgi:hypothetical protein
MDQDSSQIARKKIDTMDFKRQRELITMGGGNQ